MQKREKIIIAAAGMAVLYFMIDTFASSGDNIGEAKGSLTDLSKECEQFIARGNETLSALQSSSELFHRMTLLKGDVGGGNPFVRKWLVDEDAVSPERSGAGPRHSVRYTGYIETASMCLAVIDGREYSVNEVIDGTNLRIRDVSKERIILQPQTSTGPEDAALITVPKEVEDDVFTP